MEIQRLGDWCWRDLQLKLDCKNSTLTPCIWPLHIRN